jgi:hypothetical protein
LFNRRSQLASQARALLACVAVALAQQGWGAAAVDPHALAILDAARAASGGELWRALRAVRYRAEVSSNGMQGTAETVEDSVSGRFADHYVLGPIKGGQGFDGTAAWTQNLSGESALEESAAGKAATVNEVYRRSFAYWFRERHAATIALAGTEADGKRQFDVVRITPTGGRPFDFWIDQQSHEIARIVEKAGDDTQSTYLFEYRAVEGLRFPFRTRTSNGVEQFDTTVKFTSIELNPPLTAAMFAASTSSSDRFGLTSDYGRTTLPFALLNQHLYVDVKLNERGPFRFMLDTGGQNLISRDLAAQLGLAAMDAVAGRGDGKRSRDLGLARLERVQLGEAYADDQIFTIFDSKELSGVEGLPVNGIVGFEVVRHFVTRIDYPAGQITLYEPKRFRYVGAGQMVPFEFRESTPVVQGALDGTAGEFRLQTASDSSLTVFAPFVAKHNLLKRYAARAPGILGWDVTGARRGYLARAATLTLGTVSIDAPVLELSTLRTRSGVDGSGTGEVGTGLLARFNVVFDWGDKQMFLEPHAGTATRESYDRSGMWLIATDGGFKVVDVLPGGPAFHAGIGVADHIIAVDGHPAKEVALAALRARFRAEPAGTRIVLRLVSGRAPRQVHLTLADIV